MRQWGEDIHHPHRKRDSKPVCYAALIQTDNFIVPYWIEVTDYVLAELNANKEEAGDVYYELDAEKIQLLQQEQTLPDPRRPMRSEWTPICLRSA